MKPNELLALINRNPAFFLATVEDGEPRVRGILLYRADAHGIIFHTGAMKDLYRQLLANPAVELCFNDWQENIQVRVRGRAVLVGNPHLGEEIVNSPGREFLKPWVEKQGMEALAVFRVEGCQAHDWNMTTNFAAKEFTQLSVS
ncbi:MAG: pyridoxamine 5'-phosphate oxidase [Geobacteraceae bacterium GWC2_58_44]|nr:MAG: pyridoxamine 5'-phosphate oxidase [Geobacteraceae bacterium GWC2_58_44]HBG05411.1 pyridoxamine 5'-phosphate oxidase [Geobacter sp.]